jgi:hypothetical protein
MRATACAFLRSIADAVELDSLEGFKTSRRMVWVYKWRILERRHRSVLQRNGNDPPLTDDRATKTKKNRAE